MIVLAVDPGTAKCGVAVVQVDRVLHHEVVLTTDVVARVCALLGQYGVERVLVGNGTSMKAVRSQLEAAVTVPLEVVEEKHTTERARQRYFQDHPARGWQRLLPAGLRLPAGPIDDYAAVVMAEDYLGTEPA